MHDANFQRLCAKALFILFSLFLFSLAAANEQAASSLTEELRYKVKSQTLWKNTEWLNLLHYNYNGQNNYTSNVIEQRFFIAPNGKTNPQAELMATLSALYSHNTTEPDEHAQCRFIARFNWLKSKLPHTLTQLPQLNCPLYKTWREQMPAHKVSLIFPAYHLNSPSSMYGHTLLRIDPAQDKHSSNWLSMAVNFGANINNDDNSLLYAFKGLAGGYPGVFIVTPYFNKIKEYNRYENRDIWEYPLNLTPEETQKMVLHLWELKEINFKYYFFDENCSYRLLELLQVARPGLQLTHQFGLTAIPIDTVRSIETAGLVTGIEYRPSQATNVDFLLKKLNSDQRDFVYRLSQNSGLANTEKFKQYPHKTQSIILDAAYRYLRVKQNDEQRSDLMAKNSYELLQIINAKTDFSSISTEFKESQRPEKGHLSKRLVFAAGEDNDKTYAELKFRMSFHSLNDRLNGYLPGAQINIASLAIRATKDRLQLQQLDLVDIFSITPRNQFFQPLSWRVYSGLEQQFINGKDHLTGHVTAGAGVTYEAWPKALVYGLTTARLEANSQYTRAIEPGLGITSGLLQHFSFGTMHLELSGEEFLNHNFRHRVKLSQNITLKRNHALQFSILRQRQNDSNENSFYFTEAEFSYHYFFH